MDFSISFGTIKDVRLFSNGKTQSSISIMQCVLPKVSRLVDHDALRLMSLDDKDKSIQEEDCPKNVWSPRFRSIKSLSSMKSMTFLPLALVSLHPQHTWCALKSPQIKREEYVKLFRIVFR